MAVSRTLGDRRLRELAAIHVMKKQLGLDGETYRCLVKRVTGQESSGALDGRGRTALIEELRRLGGRRVDNAVAKERAKRVWAGRPATVDDVPLLAKIEALLADAGREWGYAHSLAHKMFGSDRAEWLRPDQMHKLVAALSIDQARRAHRKASG